MNLFCKDFESFCYTYRKKLLSLPREKTRPSGFAAPNRGGGLKGKPVKVRRSPAAVSTDCHHRDEISTPHHCPHCQQDGKVYGMSYMVRSQKTCLTTVCAKSPERGDADTSL
jgi:hypothetical protein